MGDSGAGPTPCYSVRQATWAQAADSSVDGDGESGRHRSAAGGVGVSTDVSTATASFGATSNGHVTRGPRSGESVEAGGSSPPGQRDGVAPAAGLSSLVAETNDTVPSGSHAEDGGSVAPLEPMMVAPPVTDAVDVAAVSDDGSTAAAPAHATRAAPAESPVAPPEPYEAPPEPSEAPPEPSEAPPEPSEAPPEQDGEAEDRRPTRTGNCPASPERQLVEALSDVSLDTGDIVYSNYESELQMPEIMQLIQRDLSEPYSIYTYRYFINNWPNLCFLARHTGRIVGAIVCKLDSHDSHTKRAVTSRGYIAMLAVDQRFRKRRIGSCLVLNAIRAMAADAADEVVLETEVTNKGALRLYENLGFVRDKRLFRYYLNGVDALRLKLWLWPP